MGLLSFFQRPSGSQAGARAGAAVDPRSIDAQRTRARRRLIGAAVLLGLGIVGFPLLFDTAPRPESGAIPIEIATRPSDWAPPLATVPVPAPLPSAEPTVVPGPAPAAPAEPPVASAPVPEAPKAPARSEPSPPAPVAKPADAEAARALAALEGKPAAAPVAASAAASGRFVVQVGAFSTADAARGARERVEKVGLKTYTQEVDTAAGKRIRVRVGPYDARDAAEKAAAQLRQAGLPTAILSL